MDISSVDASIIVVMAIFSLAWFVVGVLAGRQLERQPSGGRRSAPKRRKEKRRERVELYVGNLSYDVSDDDLAKAFKPCGEVLSARIIENKFNGKSKGYGFVSMGNRPDAKTAIRRMNDKQLMGRKIVVNEAKTQARD